MYTSVRERATVYAHNVEDEQEMSVRDFRAGLAEVLNEVSVRGRTVYVTSRGRRIAAMVPVVDAERIHAGRKTEQGEQ
jgi:prevent-host-death family protein